MYLNFFRSFTWSRISDYLCSARCSSNLFDSCTLEVSIVNNQILMSFLRRTISLNVFRVFVLRYSGNIVFFRPFFNFLLSILIFPSKFISSLSINTFRHLWYCRFCCDTYCVVNQTMYTLRCSAALCQNIDFSSEGFGVCCSGGDFIFLISSVALFPDCCREVCCDLDLI